MKKLIQMIVLVTLALNLPSCTTRSCLESRGGLQVLHLEGTNYERGFAHGELLKDEIHASIGRWQKEVEENFACDLNTVIAEFYASTTYREDLRNHDPGLLAEVFGMSEAAGIPYTTLLAFQMSEELSTVLGQDADVNCTTIGIAGKDSMPSLLAQNMDPPLFLHGYPLLLHVVPGKGEPEKYVFTVPGLLGLAGMNDHGVAVCCNGISMLNHNTSGIPVVSVVRNILAQPGIEGAVNFLQKCKFAIPQCFTVGGPGELRCFECSTNEVAEYYPFEDRKIVLHTNYSYKNRDFNPGFIELLAAYGKTVDDPYFCPRYFLAYDEIEACNRDLDLDHIQSILRSEKPEIEPILNQHTLGTLVMKLDIDPAIYLALGHEKEARFHYLDFK